MNDAAPTPQTPPTDRPTQMGLPADWGEEAHVLTVRPALFRANPFTAAPLLLAPIALPIVLFFATNLDLTSRGWLIGLGVFALALWGWLGVWWVRSTMSSSLYITNKRTVERRGLLSRSSDEVLHDHVRNINVRQTFLERIFNVGSIGISSAGQSDTEIQISKLPDPDRIKEVIDAYRDVLGERDSGAAPATDDGE